MLPSLLEEIQESRSILLRVRVNRDMQGLPDASTQAIIVSLILGGKTEQSLDILSKYYNMQPPEICVGTVKGKRRTAYAVYVAREKRIYAMNSEIFFNPFVMLHEFYHHLRSRSGIHRGTERHANLFAKTFIESYLQTRRVVTDNDI